MKRISDIKISNFIFQLTKKRNGTLGTRIHMVLQKFVEE